jgi:hypothetical protein
LHAIPSEHRSGAAIAVVIFAMADHGRLWTQDIAMCGPELGLDIIGAREAVGGRPRLIAGIFHIGDIAVPLQPGHVGRDLDHAIVVHLILIFLLGVL